MILLCPPEKSTHFHYPLDPKKICAEGSMPKDTTYQGSDRQDFSVYRKPTNTGLLLHHQSHVDKRYKKSLLKTMLNRAFHLLSTWESLKSECVHLKVMFTNLKTFTDTENKNKTEKSTKFLTGIAIRQPSNKMKVANRLFSTFTTTDTDASFSNWPQSLKAFRIASFKHKTLHQLW